MTGSLKDRWTGQVAVLADPHLHDTRSGRAYGLPSEDCFRSHAESSASTRVFNEAGAALVRALDILVEREVRLVMIAGDMTDDGQAPNWRAAADLLHRYSARHNMRFFLTPGNHDQWYGDGVALRKQMVRRDGTTFTLSGDGGDASTQFAPAMRRIGQAEMLNHASAFGYCRHLDDLLWETPFGGSDALSDRIGTLIRPGLGPVRVPDLSYLVEPVAGLWILSLDASVYLPGATGWDDFGTEGWNAVLRHKAWLLDWMRDVSRRAREAGKQLLAMSHFPALDVLSEVPVGLSERVMPTRSVSDAVAAAGIGLHFSGHWHINHTGGQRRSDGWMVNVAVPSTASFPAGFKLVELKGQTATIQTLRLGKVPGFDAAFGHYRAEQPISSLARTKDYDSFLTQHLRGLTGRRYLARDWPSDFTEGLGNVTLADILAESGSQGIDMAKSIPARLAVDDFYFLERGGELAGIPADRLAVYKSLGPNAPCAGDQSICRLLWGLARYSQSWPDDRFTVDMNNGSVTRCDPPQS
ncbi:MAG: metallophosphoesterase [Albidovulum sp.]